MDEIYFKRNTMKYHVHKEIQKTHEVSLYHWTSSSIENGLVKGEF